MELTRENRDRLREEIAKDSRGFFSWLFGSDADPAAPPTPAPAQVATLRASLHLGLNRVNPACYGGWDGRLRGCVNDARAMAKIAESRVGYIDHVVTLEDEEAHSGAFVAGIRAMAVTAKPGDNFLITNSSHGGQLPDANGEEADGMDETLCLFDRQLRDDEFWLELAQFPRGSNVYIVSDSCHSETVARMWNEFRAMPQAVVQGAYEALQSTYAKTIVPAVPEVVANIVLFGACGDNQVAYDGAEHGAFTNALLGAHPRDGQPFAGTPRGFLKRIVRRLAANQTPHVTPYGPEGHLLLDRPMPF